ncbi:alpha/beta-hydrolase [Leucogyrophana mollusca]|uniref:Alpha/beta-hydrolase n=1 Tax=Leucogyrophana mollusca TaxID=85980 RepID=A0ACB8B2S0_9AGAM|nr:alpha/beta-hydrolase [Leucogyrophana mollusca]
MNVTPAHSGLGWPDISSRIISRSVSLDVHDHLDMHILEAFPSGTDPTATSFPLILLLHGFPELAYSWRKIIVPLADAHSGYHVVAPDLRGFGRTKPRAYVENPRQVQYDDPLAPFHILAVAEDVRSLVRALGYTSVAMFVGHDFGSPLAGHCVIAHPDMYKSVVFMSAPFTGVDRPPSLVDQSTDGKATTPGKPTASPVATVASALAALDPPRRHYTAYFCTPGANSDMLAGDEAGLYEFLRGYIYMKGGKWIGNTTHPLPSASASSLPSIDELANDLAILPEYYVMPLHEDMKSIVLRQAREYLLTRPKEDELECAIYATEYYRTGFQGGLNYYRCALSPPPPERAEQILQLAGRRVHIPAAFIAGARDWGVYQTPGAERKMREIVYGARRGEGGMDPEDFVLIEGAGHWLQQEAPEEVVTELVRFLGKVKTR